MGVLVSPDGKATLVSATFIERLLDYDLIFEKINEIVEREKDSNHNLYAAGNIILTGWVHYYERQMLIIFLVSLAGMFLILFLYLRSLVGVITPILATTVASIWGFGFVGLRPLVRATCVPIVMVF